MLEVKRRFPDEEALKRYIKESITDITSRITASVGYLEAEYKQKRRQAWLGKTFLTTSVFVLVMSIRFLFEPVVWVSQGKYIALLLIVVSPFFIWWGLKKMRGTGVAIKRFHDGVNKTLFPIVFQIFSLDAAVVESTLDILELEKDGKTMSEADKKKLTVAVQELRGGAILTALSKERQQVLSLLDHSELISEPKNTVMVDDMFSVEFGSKALFVSEMSVKHITGGGKNKRTKNIFNGYFVSLDLDRAITGKTFVSTDGDRKGFGNQSFLKSLQGKGVQPTELEWNDFETLLHIVSSDPVEARYVLSPDFMHDLYEWWRHKKENIRISFLDSRMYILFPDKDIRFYKTIQEISEKEVQSYLESIAVPMLHVLHLAEDVERQFLR